MKLEMESTDEFVEIDGRRSRVWKGTTGGGVPIAVFILSIAVLDEADNFRFAMEVEQSGMHERMSQDTIELPDGV